MEAPLDEWVDYAAVCSSPREFVIDLLRDDVFSGGTVTAPWREATYLSAAELGPKELKQALLAAVAIPLAFPPQKVGGERYMDAGPSDPLPASELHKRGVRRIVSIFLADRTPQNRADFVGATVLQIRPSEAIDTGLFSTFDFRRTTIDRLIHLGYRDAKETFDEAQELWEHLVSLHAQGRTNVALADALPRRTRS